jgi:hypothetical protein
MRPKNDCSNDDRSDGRHQHGARRNILGVANQGMKLLDRRVGEQLQGSIQRFRCPHGAGGNHNTAPFDRAEVKIKSCAGDHYGGRRVDPRVMLRAKNVGNPVKSMPYALNSSSKLKRATHRNIGVSVPFTAIQVSIA